MLGESTRGGAALYPGLEVRCCTSPKPGMSDDFLVTNARVITDLPQISGRVIPNPSEPRRPRRGILRRNLVGRVRCADHFLFNSYHGYDCVLPVPPRKSIITITYVAFGYRLRPLHFPRLNSYCAKFLLHQYVKRGILNKDWGTHGSTFDLDFG